VINDINECTWQAIEFIHLPKQKDFIATDYLQHQIGENPNLEEHSVKTALFYS